MKTLDAVNYFGSKTKLARALGVNRSAVTQWGEHIPPNRQYQIQVITKNKLLADQQIAA